MIDIQYGIIIMGGREVSRSYLIWFFAKRLFFYVFCFSPPNQRGGSFDGVFLLVGGVVAGRGWAGGGVYLTMSFLAVPLAKRAT